jgi:starvation-inducible outer membrane lipoprotein
LQNKEHFLTNISYKGHFLTFVGSMHNRLQKEQNERQVPQLENSFPLVRYRQIQIPPRLITIRKKTVAS